MEPDDEALYQGVEVRPGVYRTKKRPYPPPRILTDQPAGIEPPSMSEYVRTFPFLNPLSEE